MRNDKGAIVFRSGERKLACPILFTEEEIQAAVRRIARRVVEDYAGKRLVLVTVLNGGKPFADDLFRELTTMPNRFASIGRDSIRVKSYEGMESTAALKWEQDLEYDCTGRHMLLAEDIVDTATTMSELMRAMRERAHSVKCAVLFNKSARRLPEYADFMIDYLGIDLEGEPFLVGYGLDFEQVGRGLRDIIVLSGSMAEELVAIVAGGDLVIEKMGTAE